MKSSRSNSKDFCMILIGKTMTILREVINVDQRLSNEVFTGFALAPNPRIHLSYGKVVNEVFVEKFTKHCLFSGLPPLN